jgi:hypothetical protein
MQSSILWVIDKMAHYTNTRTFSENQRNNRENVEKFARDDNLVICTGLLYSKATLNFPTEAVGCDMRREKGTHPKGQE